MLARIARIALLGAVLAAVVLPLTASAATSDTIRVSVATGGGQFVNGSYAPSLNSSGSLVVFTTRTSSGTDYSRYNVMLRDVASNVTTLVSAGPSGTPPQYSDSAQGVISSDGSTVAFATDATLLAAGSNPGDVSVVARVLSTGAIVPVSVSSLGTWGSGTSSDPSLSADGRYVAFTSDAGNLVPGDTNGQPDVFVRDTVGGTTVRASVSSAGGQSNSFSIEPSISGDGRYVVFRSRASNLVAGDSNDRDDIFIRDLVAGTTARVSVSTAGRQSAGNSRYPSVSANGRYVVFAATADDLTAGDTNKFADVLVRDLVTRTTVRASIGSRGTQGNGAAWFSAISGDGRYVAFETAASNLTFVDANKARIDILVRDMKARLTWPANVSSSGQQAVGQSRQPAFSADGSMLGFMSEASNLVPGDSNQVTDVFRRAALVKPAQLSMRASATSVSRGSYVTLQGQLFGLTGGLYGKKVSLQSSSTGSAWRTIASATTAGGGAYAFRRKPSATTWYRVTYSGGSGYGPAMSWSVRVRVR